MKYLLSLLYFVVLLDIGNAQTASRLAPLQTFPNGIPKNLLWVDTSDLDKIKTVSLDSLPVTTAQIKGLNDTLLNVVNSLGYITQSTASGLYQPVGTYLIPSDTANKWQSKGAYLTSVDSSKFATLYYADNHGPVISVNGQSGSVNLTIPTQLNLTAGSNVSITGSYPNLIISSTNTTPLYTKSGLVSSTSVPFVDTFSVSSATPTIDLSSYIATASKTSCKILSAIAFRPGATVSTSPNVSITGMTATSVSLIITQTNTATVTILGVNILSGLPTILVPDPTNIKVELSGYSINIYIY